MVPHPIETFSAKSLAELRKATFTGPARNGTPIGPEIYFSWDNEVEGTALTLSSRPGMLLTIRQKVTRRPRWLSLNIPLGSSSLAPGDVLGFIADIEGFADHEMALFIRSARNGTQADTPIPETLSGAAGQTIRTLLYTIEPDAPLAGGEGFHTLILNLPAENGILTLNDLRVFVVPATSGLRSVPPTLGDFGSTGPTARG